MLREKPFFHENIVFIYENIMVFSCSLKHNELKSVSDGTQLFLKLVDDVQCRFT